MFVFAIGCLIYWVCTTEFIWARIQQGFWDKRILDPIPDELAEDPVPAQTSLESDPVFNLVARDGFMFFNPLILDGNYLRTIQTDGESPYLLPLVITFENSLVLPDGDNRQIQDVNNVWAELSFHPVGMLDVQMARIATGVWVDEPLSDISFPVGVPKHLVIGVREYIGRNPGVNEFRLFQYSRTLHRAERMSTHFETPQHLIVKVKLTPGTLHHLATEFQVVVDLPDVTLHLLTPEQVRLTGLDPHPMDRVERIIGSVVPVAPPSLD